MVHLFIQPLTAAAKEIYGNKKSTNLAGDAGFDFTVPEDIIVPEGSTCFVKLGIKAAAYDENNKAVSWLLMPRSSIAKTPLRLSNSVGLIDSGYRGEIMAAVDNIRQGDYKLSKGDRIVQAVAFNGNSITHSVVDKLDDTERGEGGFGSTN